MSHSVLPITALITSRRRELGLREVDLVRRCGYQNIAKGLRRLERICQGSVYGSDALIMALPRALEVPTEVVAQAILDTGRELHEAEEAAWRECFRPHAIILPERCRPQPVFVAGIIGIDQLLLLELDPKQGTISFVRQALEGLRKRMARWNSSIDTSGVDIGDLQLPAFGRPVAFVINYSPDEATVFDLHGNPIQILDAAYRVGEVKLTIGGRPFSAALLMG